MRNLTNKKVVRLYRSVCVVHCWTLLGTAGTLIDTVGHYVTLLDTVGHCWTLLNTVGRCWTLLDTVGHW